MSEQSNFFFSLWIDDNDHYDVHARQRILLSLFLRKDESGRKFRIRLSYIVSSFLFSVGSKMEPFFENLIGSRFSLN